MQQVNVLMRLIRRLWGDSQAEAAQSMGWDQARLSRMEGGKVPPGPEDLHAFCNLYSCSLDTLIRPRDDLHHILSEALAGLEGKEDNAGTPD